jgi:hypothetical protein
LTYKNVMVAVFCIMNNMWECAIGNFVTNSQTILGIKRFFKALHLKLGGNFLKSLKKKTKFKYDNATL